MRKSLKLRLDMCSVRAYPRRIEFLGCSARPRSQQTLCWRPIQSLVAAPESPTRAARNNLSFGASKSPDSLSFAEIHRRIHCTLTPRPPANVCPALQPYHIHHKVFVTCRPRARQPQVASPSMSHIRHSPCTGRPARPPVARPNPNLGLTS